MHHVLMLLKGRCDQPHCLLGIPQGEQQSNASYLSARRSAMAPVLLRHTTLVEATLGSLAISCRWAARCAPHNRPHHP